MKSSEESFYEEQSKKNFFFENYLLKTFFTYITSTYGSEEKNIKN